MQEKERSFPIQHRFISWLQDFDIRGVRRFSAALPKVLLPAPATVGKHILKTPDGIRLLINPSVDKAVELALYETGSYEKGILAYLKKSFPKEGCFVDVGANIGLMSLFVSRYFPSAEIHAFEAHPDTAKILEYNISLNSFAKKMKSHAIAVGARSEKVTIFQSSADNRGDASIIRGTQGGVEIDCKPLDELLSGSNVAVIKVDVEGYEWEVLQGAKAIIHRDHPQLIIEISKERDNEMQTVQIWDFLHEQKYHVFKLKGTKGRKSKLVEVKAFADLPDHDNIICI